MRKAELKYRAPAVLLGVTLGYLILASKTLWYSGYKHEKLDYTNDMIRYGTINKVFCSINFKIF